MSVVAFEELCEEAPHTLDGFTSDRVERRVWKEALSEVKPSQEIWGEAYWQQVKDYTFERSNARPGRVLTYGPRARSQGSSGRRRALDIPWKKKGRGNGRGE